MVSARTVSEAAVAGVRVRDVMTRRVVYLPAGTPLDEAASAMRDADIGDVVVTDRDIVVRAVAEARDVRQVTLGSIATREIVMIEQNAGVEAAAALMRERAVRRVLVCDNDRRLVGIVSLGDLATCLAPSPARADGTSALR